MLCNRLKEPMAVDKCPGNEEMIMLDGVTVTAGFPCIGVNFLWEKFQIATPKYRIYPLKLATYFMQDSHVKLIVLFNTPKILDILFSEQSECIRLP